MKKSLALALAVALSLSLTGCLSKTPTASPPAASIPAASTPATSAPAAVGDGAPAVTSTEKVTIIWSHNAPESSSGHKAALKFKEEMETRSNGMITVDIYPNGELGSVPENDQAVREGTIQIASGTSGGLVDPKLSYFDCPNMVDSNEQALAMVGRDTELFQYTADIYETLGMKVLSFVPGGFRETSSNKAIRSYAELAGLNIRTLENPIAISYWKSWGCNPTPVAFSELYIALQQGLVEAQENTYDTILSSKLYEQQKYIINTHHVIMWSGIYMNMDFYRALPQDYRDLLDWVCANVMDDYLYQNNVADNQTALTAMQKAGLEVIDLTPEDYQQMRDAAKPAYDLIRQSAGDQAMDLIAAAQASAQQ